MVCVGNGKSGADLNVFIYGDSGELASRGMNGFPRSPVLCCALSLSLCVYVCVCGVSHYKHSF